MDVRRSFSRFIYPTKPPEETYALFPPGRNVYKDRRLFVPNTYEVETNYKFRVSKYYTAPSPPKHKPPRLQDEDPTAKPPSPRPTSRYNRIQEGFRIARELRRSAET